MSGHKKTIAQLIELYNTIMTLFKSFADDFGVEFILFYGSLLGYHRDGQFIHHDDDIDVIAPLSCREKLLQYIRTANPNTVRITYNTIELLQLYIITNDANDAIIGPFDIYFYEDPSNSSDILIKWDGNLLFKKCDIFPTRNVVFNGHSILIPHNPAAILLELYGPEWVLPKTKNVDYVWEKITTVRRLPAAAPPIVHTSSNNTDFAFIWKHGPK
jgi:phosphorylcholine metabolism protein LicD